MTVVADSAAATLRLSRRQPALLAFVTAFSEDLSKDGTELGMALPPE